MNPQLAFDLGPLPPRSRTRDPETSKAAARAVTAVAGEHERVILAAIEAAGRHGVTAKEIANRANINAVEVARATGKRPVLLTDVQVNRRLSSIGERQLIFRRFVHAATCGNPSPAAVSCDCGGELVKRRRCAVWWFKV